MKPNLQVVSILRPVLLLGAGLVTLAAGAVRADEIAPIAPIAPNAPAPGEAARPSAGGYGGVTPGATGANPLPQPPPGSSPYLIWTGFQPTASGSRVFIQTTAPVEFDVNPGRMAKGKSTLTVLLRDCRIHMANNRRKLDTRAFPTPVQSVTAKQRGKNVELRIALRQEAAVTSGTEPGPQGSRFLVLDFPPGTATPDEIRAPVRAAVESNAPTSGEGWSFSDGASPASTESKGKAKGKGSARKAGEATGKESGDLEPGRSPGAPAQ